MSIPELGRGPKYLKFFIHRSFKSTQFCTLHTFVQCIERCNYKTDFSRLVANLCKIKGGRKGGGVVTKTPSKGHPIAKVITVLKGSGDV